MNAIVRECRENIFVKALLACSCAVTVFSAYTGHFSIAVCYMGTALFSWFIVQRLSTVTIYPDTTVIIVALKTANHVILTLITLFKCFFDVGSKNEDEFTYNGATIRTNNVQITSDLLPNIEAEGEAEIFIKYVIRDYFESWYTLLSNEGSSIDDAHSILEDTTGGLFQKLRNLDNDTVFRDCVSLYTQHLRAILCVQEEHANRDISLSDLLTSGQLTLAFKTSSLTSHPALRSRETELDHARQITENLLTAFVPFDACNCKAVSQILKEVFTCNILVPCIDTMAQPQWIYSQLNQILAGNVDSTHESIDTQTLSDSFAADSGVCDLTVMPPADETKGAELLVSQTECAAEMINENISVSDFPVMTIQADGSYLESPHQCNNTLSTHEAEQELLDATTPNIPSGYTHFVAPDLDPEDESSQQMFVSSELSRYFSVASPDATIEPESVAFTRRRASDASDTLSMSSSGCVNLPWMFVDPDSSSISSSCSGQSDWSTDHSLRVGPVGSSPHSSNASDLPSFPSSDNTLECSVVTMDTAEEKPATSEVPIHRSNLPRQLFDELCISGTETTQDSSGCYTLFIISYTAWYESVDTVECTRRSDMAGCTLFRGFAKRRYREFVALHECLQAKREYRRQLKSVRSPNRWTSLPFGNMGVSSVQRRVKMLQAYLQALIGVPGVQESSELKEFLAYNSDRRIAFVRRAVEIPRLDKAISRTMTGLLDRIGRIIPGQSVPSTTAVDSGQADCTPILEDWTDTLNVQFKFDLESPFQRMLTRCAQRARVDLRLEMAAVSSSRFTAHTDGAERRSEADGCESLTMQEPCPELARVTFDLLLTTLSSHPSWLLNTGAFSILRRITAKPLNSWLRSQLAFLSSSSQCALYIRRLRQSIWRPLQTVAPAGAKDPLALQGDSHQNLRQLFPVWLRVMVGRENFEHSLNMVLSSFEDPLINRHLLYGVLDILLKHVLSPKNS